MDLASKFDTGAAKAAFKKKMSGPSSSPERYRAETQSNNIKKSLAERRAGYAPEIKNNEAQAAFMRDMAKIHRDRDREYVRELREEYFRSHPDDPMVKRERANAMEDALRRRERQ